MRKDYIWYIAMFALILITIGLYIDDIEDKKDTEFSYARCSLKGHFEEFKKYDKGSRKWVVLGSYRKDTVYELDKLGNVSRGYDLIFADQENYNKISCQDVLKVNCDKEDINKLYKFAFNDEDMYDFMDVTFYEKVESLESNGYECIKE